MRTIREEELLTEIAMQMGCAEGAEFPVERFLRDVERVIVSNDAVKILWSEVARVV